MYSVILSHSGTLMYSVILKPFWHANVQCNTEPFWYAQCNTEPFWYANVQCNTEPFWYARDVDILGNKPSPSLHVHQQHQMIITMQYQHLPAMPDLSEYALSLFRTSNLAAAELYITCALAKVTLLSEQLMLGPNAFSTLSSSPLFTLADTCIY